MFRMVIESNSSFIELFGFFLFSNHFAPKLFFVYILSIRLRGTFVWSQINLTCPVGTCFLCSTAANVVLWHSTNDDANSWEISRKQPEKGHCIGLICENVLKIDSFTYLSQQWFHSPNLTEISNYNTKTEQQQQLEHYKQPNNLGIRILFVSQANEQTLKEDL